MRSVQPCSRQATTENANMVSHASEAAFAVRFCSVTFNRSPLRVEMDVDLSPEIPANREAIACLKGVAGDVRSVAQRLLKLVVMFWDTGDTLWVWVIFGADGQACQWCSVVCELRRSSGACSGGGAHEFRRSCACTAESQPNVTQTTEGANGCETEARGVGRDTLYDLVNRDCWNRQGARG